MMRKYSEPGFSGFLIEDIEKYLGPERFAKFNHWFCGQTGAITKDGKLLVYTHDWERFLLSLPVID